MKEELEYVVLNSKYVSIDKSKINRFISDLGPVKYEHWSKELDLKLNEKEWVLLAFIIELIKESLKSMGIIVNSVELDNLIGWMGKKIENKSTVHHTITIYY